MINNKLLKGAAAAGGLVPGENFNTVLYTGNGATTQSITGVGFSADFIWIKARSFGASHSLQDTVRGVGAAKTVNSDNNSAQGTNGAYGFISSFDTDGFTVNLGSGSGAGHTNKTDVTYVAWCWKAGGSSNTFNKNGTGYASASAAGLTAGTTAPSASSVNTDTGFSIIKVTTDVGSNKTIPHGLGVKPSLVIWKRLDSAEEGWVYTDVIDGSQDYLILNSSGAKFDGAEAVATTDVVSAPTTGQKTYVSYIFASIPEYSKVGKYTGNGATQHIDCGFEPAWLLTKRTNANAYDWHIWDNKTNTTNPRDQVLRPNLSHVETDYSLYPHNFTTTGFQINTADAAFNGSGEPYLFYAIAADPDTTTPTVAKSFAVQKYTGNGAVSHIGRPIRFGSSVSLQILDTSQIELNTVINKSVFQGSDVSVSMWVQINTLATSTSDEGAHAWTVCDGGWGIQCSTEKTQFTLYHGGSPSFHSIVHPPLEPGYWYHLCASMDYGGTGMRFWVTKDGQAAISSAGTNSYAGGFDEGSQDGVGFGAYNDYDNRRGFGGLITQARIYTQSLTDAQAGKLYLESVNDSGTQNPSTTGFPSNCLALYRFQGNANAVPTSKNGVGTGDTYYTNSIGFKPDLTIIKNRDTNDGWRWFDTQRGVLNRLESSATHASANLANSLTSFNNAGFTLGSEATVNTSGEKFISYSMKMLDSNNNAAIEMDGGSINSLVSANPSAGMSIVKYTGNGSEVTVSHGLSAVPNFIIVKNITSDTENSWVVWNTTQSSQSQFLVLNSLGAYLSNSGVFGSTAHTTSVFNIGNLRSRNGIEYIAYCFHSVSGFSKFGSYNGDNSTDRLFNIGFAADFVMIKKTNGISHWQTFDSVRGGNAQLDFDSNAEEYTGGSTPIEFVSNGFKIKSNYTTYNATGGEYIYWAMKIN